MTQTKVDFDLTGVPQTLILPLIGRAVASQSPNSVLKDQRALDTLRTLNYKAQDYQTLLESDVLHWAADRALFFDDEVRAFLQQQPKGLIVNIGAGLETAFYRLDNEQLTWIDTDVPDVISLREKVFPKHDRIINVAKSIFDFSWIEDVKKQFKPTFMFSGGVFLYFKPEEVKEVFIEMAKHLQGTELVFDTINQDELHGANRLLKEFSISDASLKWAFNAEDVESWSANIKVIYHKQVNAKKEATHFHSYMAKVRFVEV